MARALAKRAFSLADARRAIYIDFEGEADKHPVLLGSLYAEGRKADENRIVLHHSVLDRGFKKVRSAEPLDGFYKYELSTESMKRSILALVERAEKQGRLIVSWSDHELGVVEKYVEDASLIARFRELFRDGKASGKRWFRRELDEERLQELPKGESHTLMRYFDYLGYKYPHNYGLGETAKRIKRVQIGLEKRDDWDSLLESQREAWMGVLMHNAADCEGLRHVVMSCIAAGE